MVRITTWNVNGIRNPFGYQPWRTTRSFNAMFDILEADIVIMQELKIQRKDLRDDMVLVAGWDCFFSLPKHKKGYSGVGIYTRQSACAPIRAEEGLLGVLCPPGSSTPYRELPDNACIGGYLSPTQVADLGVDPVALDSEGRCVVIEFPAFVLFGVYSPANSNGQRDDFRKGFLCALDARIRNLSKMGKYVILTGDLNVSREEIDTAKADEAMAKEGITRQDYYNAPNRRIFNQLLEHGKVMGERDEGREKPVLWDLCREFHPDREGMFTHWEQKINARPANFGSRIDYVLCSIEISSWFSESNIQEGLAGSDHCPVYASTKDLVEWHDTQTHILDIMNPKGMYEGGVRLREFDSAKDILPFSGKLLPEFDGRRTIKDMFAKTSALIGRKSTLGDSPVKQHASETSKGSSQSLSTSSQTSESPMKRRLPGPATSRPVKRSKSNIGSSSSQPQIKGQQSLRGFFTAKTTDLETPPPALDTATSSSALSPPSSAASASASASAAEDTTLIPFSEPFIDPEASKESWTKLFSKKPPPRCEDHSEPCVSLMTKKPGVNCGRSFWICPRPIGPSGAKEKGTQWRCRTFIWASDWNAPAAQDG
ncbi:DNase I-like protein [Pleomassaria siparia CBS 279.74]|uniref:DNA-(apurinic or apyrimidinic site) endonuclease 2 n=1 Tax=Pleomassaria siparia CBS 279.74 TaxID=1314801 RepID=A0A6G1KBG9_9PLEO|nr:DNase I-like protein [Pleomassaria siparia CBS 279.74]